MSPFLLLINNMFFPLDFLVRFVINVVRFYQIISGRPRSVRHKRAFDGLQFDMAKPQRPEGKVKPWRREKPNIYGIWLRPFNNNSSHVNRPLLSLVAHFASEKHQGCYTVIVTWPSEGTWLQKALLWHIARTECHHTDEGWTPSLCGHLPSA